MQSIAESRYPTLSLLRDWMVYFYSRRPGTKSKYCANDVAYVAVLSGNPPGF